MLETQMVLRVRFRTDLTREQVTEIVEARAPEFAALAGLRQKYYLHDPASGEYAGLYVWESRAAFAAYRDSELRATIAQAYQTHGEPDVEVYEVFKVLRPEQA